MLVSCLMVSRPERTMLARDAVDCFKTQTYPSCELVVISDPVPGESRKGTLGALRNESIEKATGHYVCQWDDDDLSSSDRVACQVAFLQEREADLCFIDLMLIECICGEKVTCTPLGRYWECSMLARKSSLEGVRYAEEMTRGEDTVFVDALIAKGLKIALLKDRSDLYTYRLHATSNAWGNTWGPRHFDQFFSHGGSKHRPSACAKSRGLVKG